VTEFGVGHQLGRKTRTHLSISILIFNTILSHFLYGLKRYLGKDWEPSL